MDVPSHSVYIACSFIANIYFAGGADRGEWVRVTDPWIPNSLAKRVSENW